MKVNYDAKENKFSIIDLTGSEAGALAGAIEFAIEEKKKQNMYEITREKGEIKIVEDIATQLLSAEFLRNL